MYENIIQSSKWYESHGADAKNNHASMGSIYFSLPYLLKAKKCVCLGSGGGFVPKLMHLAQTALIEEKLLKNVDISLVDADIGIWGRPVYGNSIPDYPDIKLIKELTDNACDQFYDINYLHVDADHTHDQVYKDLKNYGSRMADWSPWAITIHDTYNIGAVNSGLPIGCYSAAKQWAAENDYDIVNFPIGCGTALIMPRMGC